MDSTEKMELIQDIIGHLEDAANYLKELGGYESDIDTLDDISSKLNCDLIDVESDIVYENREEDQEMVRDYWRDEL